MTKYVWVLGLVIALIACNGAPKESPSAQNDLDIILEKFHNPTSGTLIAAHRGDWRNAPENSLLGIQLCIDKGFDIVEVDVRKTKDGHLVLMHDETLDRTTDGQGKVSVWTLDSLKRLHLKNGLGRLTEESIPTLEEALILIEGKIMINLDKAYAYIPDVVKLLEKTGTMQQVILKGSVTAEQVRSDVGNNLHDLLFMPVIRLDVPDAFVILQEYRKHVRPHAYEFIFDTDTAKVINLFSQLRDEGARVWVNSLWGSLCGGHDDDRALVSPDSTWGWLLQHDVSIIQTDRPETLSKYIRKRESSSGLTHSIKSNQQSSQP